MAFYAIDAHRLIQRLIQECIGADNRDCSLVEAVSAKQAWTNSGAMSEPVDSSVCSSCRHRYCHVCEECSAGKEYSDYWICHCCGALSRRLPSWH